MRSKMMAVKIKDSPRSWCAMPAPRSIADPSLEAASAPSSKPFQVVKPENVAITRTWSIISRHVSGGYNGKNSFPAVEY